MVTLLISRAIAAMRASVLLLMTGGLFWGSTTARAWPPTASLERLTGICTFHATQEHSLGVWMLKGHVVTAKGLYLGEIKSLDKEAMIYLFERQLSSEPTPYSWRLILIGKTGKTRSDVSFTYLLTGHTTLKCNFSEFRLSPPS